MSWKLLEVGHFVLFLFLSFYAFVFPTKYDLYYLLLQYCIYFSWTLFDGKCFMTYYYQKHIGSAASVDLNMLFGLKYRNFMQGVRYFCLASMFIGMYVLCRRNQIPFLFAFWPFPTYYVLSYVKSKIIDAIFSAVFLYYVYYIYSRLSKR